MSWFIAVNLAEGVLNEVDRAVRPLREKVPARWVPAHKQHVTLVFLGELPPERLAAILTATQVVASQHSALHLGVAGASGFPHARKPRVLWLGITGDLDALAALKADLDRALLPCGVQPEERSFRPHLTLARATHPRGDRDLAECVEQLNELVFGDSLVTHLCMYESRPGAAGYVLHAKFPLARAFEVAPSA